MARCLAASDKAYNRAWRKSDRANKRAFLLGYAQRTGCKDCGLSDPRVLEFDHREQTSKVHAVAHMVSFSYSYERIIAEIDKCEVRCANCHKLRTGIQLDWYKGFEKWLT